MPPSELGAAETRWTAPASSKSTFVFAVLVFVLALTTRIALLNYPPIYDELYQMLPAQSWRVQGDFAVLDGVYDRAMIFTQLIALAFDLSGDDGVAAARFWPSTVPGALLVALVFAWTRASVGIFAGWVVAVFMLLWPNGIELSQYARFYALHGLAFVAGALALYRALEKPISLAASIFWGLIAAAFFLFSAKLQLSTVVGLMGLSLWILIAHLPNWLRVRPWLWWFFAGGVLLVAGVLASGALTETLSLLWFTFRWEPWPAVGDTFFYHRILRDNYPTFWPLLPVAVLVALAVRPRPAAFCAALFATGFTIHSFGGLKGLRYLYWVMPFFFVLWAITLQALVPLLAATLSRFSWQALSPYTPRLLRRRIAVTALMLAATFLFAANAAFERSINLTIGQPADSLLGKPRYAWPDAPALLHPWLKDGALIITSEEMLAIEYLGDFDLAYNKPRFSEFAYSMGPNTPPFTIDRRTGRPLFGDYNDLERLMRCAPVGLVVANASWLIGSDATRLTVAAAETGATVQAETKGGTALLAWRRSRTTQLDGCETLIPPPDDRAATRILSGARRPAMVSIPDATIENGAVDAASPKS